MNVAFSATLRKELRSKALSLGWLANKCSATYEHMRKLANGEAYPSRLMLKAICSALEIDFDVASQQVNRDKIRRKFGIDTMSEPKDELLVQLDEMWAALDDQTKNSLVNFAKANLPPLEPVATRRTTYIAQAETSQLIKIGRSSNLRDRIQALEAGTGCKMRVLACISGDCEAQLHHRFRAYRRQGEWFEPANEILEYARSMG